jgi:hypothetical protein
MNSIVHVHIVKKSSYYIFYYIAQSECYEYTFDYTVLYCEKRVEMSTNGMEIHEQKGEVSDFNRLPLHIFMSL